MIDSNKYKYLQEESSRQMQSWLNRALPLAAVLFPFIAIAEFFITPENFHNFLIYRFGISIILLFLLILNKLKRNLLYQYMIGSAALVFSAALVELMILSFGGNSSIYYAGINLVIIVTLAFIPFNLFMSVSVTILVYAIYLIPLLIIDKITNLPLFISNNVFIISTIAIALTWRILTNKRIINELSFQYDLTQQKKLLEFLVEERTKELKKSEEQHRALFNYATDGIVVMDKDGIIINVNNKTCEMHGYSKESLIGASIFLLE